MSGQQNPRQLPVQTAAIRLSQGMRKPVSISNGRSHSGEMPDGLPVTLEDEPDVAAMEAMVRNLPAWKLLEQSDASTAREVIAEAS